MNKNIARIGIYAVIRKAFLNYEKIFLFKMDFELRSDNVEHILQETSRKLLTESLKVCETHIQTNWGI